MKLQQLVEEKVGVLIVFTLLVVSVGLFIEVVPLFFSPAVTKPIEGVKPYTALQVAGRDVYIREGPFQWGSKRTGPDLARVGGRYSDEWHRIHLNNPRDVVPESNMPAFPWLARNKVDPAEVVAHMKGLKTLGTPYTDEEIAKAPEELKDKSELDAVVAYLQGLGLALKNVR